VDGVRADLVAEQEGRAELDRGGACDQGPRDAGTVDEAARGDERQIHVARDQAQKREHAQTLGLIGVQPAAPMPAGLNSLQHQHISAGGLGCPRLGHVGDRHPHLAPDGLEVRDLPGAERAGDPRVPGSWFIRLLPGSTLAGAAGASFVQQRDR